MRIPSTTRHSFYRLFRPKRVRTGGSRERPSVRFALSALSSRTLGENIALGG